ncbi:MAG: cupin domain-containing protein [Tannerella sp.]|jgi:transcriptional regulator with XRE-family HTH domain|nr:cupin domain-containing protein [Tannerella sp.]
MNEQIRQIAERLRGLRDALDITAEEMAATCGLDTGAYLALESGTVDISVSVLHRIAHRYNVELTALMFGDEPTMNAYFVTRRGKGVAVERTHAYRYRSLAAGFVHRSADPFMVTVHPKPDGEPVHLNTHAGQEFNFVVDGRLLLRINGKDLVLEQGDSIYFNSELPHGMKALDGQPVSFLAVIL